MPTAHHFSFKTVVIISIGFTLLLNMPTYKIIGIRKYNSTINNNVSVNFLKFKCRFFPRLHYFYIYYSFCKVEFLDFEKV